MCAFQLECLLSDCASAASVAYLEGHRVINLANETFGFNGWATQIMRIDKDFEDHKDGKWHYCCSVVVRVVLRDGSFHEDVGCGQGLAPNRSDAVKKAKKEAVTDARKRALRVFGDGLGLCIANKKYLEQARQASSGSAVMSSSALSGSSASRPMLSIASGPLPPSPTASAQPPPPKRLKEDPGSVPETRPVTPAMASSPRQPIPNSPAPRPVNPIHVAPPSSTSPSVLGELPAQTTPSASVNLMIPRPIPPTRPPNQPPTNHARPVEVALEMAQNESAQIPIKAEFQVKTEQHPDSTTPAKPPPSFPDSDEDIDEDLLEVAQALKFPPVDPTSTSKS